MNVRWHRRALEDLDRLHDFLLARDADAAGRALEAVLAGAEKLGRHPRMGRLLPDGQRREWPVEFGAGAYVLRYRLAGDAVLIIRVWHSRELR